MTPGWEKVVAQAPNTSWKDGYRQEVTLGHTVTVLSDMYILLK